MHVCWVYVHVCCVHVSVVTLRGLQKGGTLGGEVGKTNSPLHLLHTDVLEWRTLEKAHQMVLPRCDHTEWPHGTVVDGVDGLAVSCDLTH